MERIIVLTMLLIIISRSFNHQGRTASKYNSESPISTWLSRSWIRRLRYLKEQLMKLRIQMKRHKPCSALTSFTATTLNCPRWESPKLKEKAETTTTRQRSDTKVHNSGQDIGQVELDQENMPDLISVKLKVDHFYITLEINVSGSEIYVKSRSLLDLNDGNINLSKKVWHVGRFIKFLPPKLIAIEKAKVVKNQQYDFTYGMTQSKIYFGNSKNNCMYLILLVHESESDNHDKSDEKKMKLFLKNLHTENIKEYWPHKWIANTIGKEVTNMENYLIWQLSANSYFYDRMKSNTKKDLSIEMESYVFKISNEKFNLTFKKNLHPKTDTHEMRQVTANIIAGKKFKIKISNVNSTIYQILETNNDEKMLFQCKIQLFWAVKKQFALHNWQK
ncbi:uncharacterized protein LOC120423355 [Culex pipiens pallens]|uniref:uncharacterized protein LOC120423355 n=1 Tax=Culex pipiens pallens TaxID=42434 RepID=UPI0022AB4CE0|nr:uncharacterized protein LOC120423355 [Culex pipiens pallens]XP_039443065.2 uncharacterized protein LOC120423355 [Culex pipiens pallens]